ncbi:hypothetical protein A6U86_32810 [Rhizobium sp. AC27/96]|uniref:DUF2934 domain-containing protein n=1 Tax=Rhizobium TaxID=379 RepID=UPI0008290508|nr:MULTISPECIES: DUF2934 domain-containing protein [Rhizobium]NTF46596.1 DUF2934 domain-containing protein [Rhizobium rhizogenes]OCI99614.1 hypothetical protein A6U86_32810 [Rhizobium sp. AC27/96]
MDSSEENHRERAYRIWEQEGRPEGRHLDHWQKAEDQHEATEKEADEALAIEAKAKKSSSGKKSKVSRTP